MASHTVPSGSVSALCTVTMFLCRSRQSAMASLRARSRARAELAWLASSSLSATLRCVNSWTAS
ncbi:hypothetical protein WME91_15845 [Sorangium sp. So ce269]